MDQYTRAIVKALNRLEETFDSMYDVTDFRQMVHQLEKSRGRSDTGTVIAALQRMLDSYKIRYDRSERRPEYFRSLVDSINFDTDNRNFEKMIQALYDIYKEYHDPEAFMQRLVDRLCNKKDGWEKDVLRLRILKQFIRYGNYLQDVKRLKKNGEPASAVGGRAYIHKYLKEKHPGLNTNDRDVVIEALDENVFQEYGQALIANQKDVLGIEDKYGLLKIADDLAAGKIGDRSSTKRELYWFGMVYDMTYSPQKSDKDNDERNDIDKDLFRDYYINNLIRYVSDTRKRGGTADEDPKGYGINFKNFAEMVYLYYINRKDLSPEEKIKKSSDLILKLMEEQKKKGDVIPENYYMNENQTLHYRNIFLEDFFLSSEEEMESFVLRNYNCSTDRIIDLNTRQPHFLKQPIGLIQVESGQQTAKDYLDEIYTHLIETGWIEDIRGFWIYEDLKNSIHKLKSNKAKKVKDNPEDDKRKEEMKDFEDFVKILEYFQDLMRQDFSTITAETVSRSKLLVVVYYDFLSKMKNEQDEEFRSFRNIYEAFKLEANRYLEECCYQSFSERNLFDVLLAFSAYTYVKF